MLTSPAAPAVNLAADLALSLDPALVMERAGQPPDPWQAQLLRSTARRVLVNCARQTGKSTTAAALAVHLALYASGSLSLLFSPSQRQSGELFRRALALYRASGGTVPIEAESALRLELTNGSRVLSLPGKAETVRGFSPDLIVVDESAFVGDDLYAALRPMLAVSAGRFVALGTPFGRRGWWYEAWRSGEDWERYEVTATDCPRITPEFLASERASLGDWAFSQEYLCGFEDVAAAVFRADDIARAFSEPCGVWRL